MFASIGGSIPRSLSPTAAVFYPVGYGAAGVGGGGACASVGEVGGACAVEVGGGAVMSLEKKAEETDYGSDGRRFVGDGAYAVGQKEGGGAVKMVQIIGAEDDAVAGGFVDVGGASTVAREQLVEVHRDFEKSWTLADAEEFCGLPADKVPVAEPVVGGGDDLGEYVGRLLGVFEQPLCSMVVDADPGGGSVSECRSESLGATTADFAEGGPKSHSMEDVGPQQDAPDAILPHLRVGSGLKGRYDISDSECSMRSAMSNLSMDKFGDGVSIGNTFGSIRVEDLVTIASKAYAERYGVTTGMVSCVVDPNPRIGSRNTFYVARFSQEDNPQERKWMIRIPRQGRFFSRGERSWLESDIRSMRFVKERTDIPVPSVYGFDSGTQNKIGMPYVLMGFIEGDRVEDVWDGWNEEKRITCLSQCAEFMGELGRFSFNAIGVLGCDYRKGEYIVHGIPSITKRKGLSLAGPFPTVKAYLGDTWRRKVEILGSSEEVKNKQFLVLLKLLIPALVDLEPVTERFFLSLPEFGGGNVLVDHDGNVTGFVGWQKAMVMPKSMGYARYPEWIAKDWISSQQGKSPEADMQTGGTSKAKVVPEINPKLLTEASQNSGKTIETAKGSEDVVRGCLLGESEGILGKSILDFRAPASPTGSRVSENGDETKEVVDSPQTGGDVSTGPLEAASSQVPLLIPALADDSLPDGGTPVESNRSKKKKGRKEGYRNNWGGSKRSNRGNKQQPRQRQEYDYDESIELQRAVTDEDKTKVHAVSKWNALTGEIVQKEAEEREERKKARIAKEEEDKAAGVKKETPMVLKVVETFKKVVVEQNLERKLLEVVKIERSDSLDGAIGIKDARVTPLPQANDMVRYRKIYYELFTKTAPEDEMAIKFSHITTAVHTAITNDNLRPVIVPRLAKYVFGAAVGPSLLGMVGSGQWAKELLTKIAESKGEQKKVVRFAEEDEQFDAKDELKEGNGETWELLIFGPPLFIGVVVVTLSALVGASPLPKNSLMDVC